MANSVEDFSFGDDSISTGGFRKADPKLHFKKGEKARMSFGWWPTDADGNLVIKPGTRPRLRQAIRHFFEKQGYILRPKGAEGEEFDKLAGKDPKTVFATVMVRWPLDRQGHISRESLTDASAVVWTPPKPVVDFINMSIKQEVDLATSDIYLECTDEEFQKMVVSIVPRNLLAEIQAAKPQFFKDLQNSIEARLEDISYHVGREMDINTLKEKLGLAPASSGAGGGNAQATQQVDPDALTGLLDGALGGLL